MSRGYDFMQGIPLYDTFVRIEPIDKGMSGDKKYYISTAKGEHFLLRIGDYSKYNIRKSEFEIMVKIRDLGVPMPSPIDFGICNGGKNTYTLLTWIVGKEVELVLPGMPEAKQYRMGFEAGEILRKIHMLPAKKQADDWYSRYFAVIDERLDAFRAAGISFEGDKIVLNFLQENRCLLKNRPQCYLHGDYHTGNLIQRENGHLSVIDWHTVDFENYGDPWYEFNRIGAGARAGFSAFASGQIDGYFQDNTPQAFWRLLAYYLSASSLTSIVWAKHFSPENVSAMLELNLSLLYWFDNMKESIPLWYKRTGWK